MKVERLNVGDTGDDNESSAGKGDGVILMKRVMMV